jgi:hypothetical protein
METVSLSLKRVHELGCETKTQKIKRILLSPAFFVYALYVGLSGGKSGFGKDVDDRLNGQTGGH